MFIKLSKFWNHQVKQSSFKECHYNDISISICIELIPNMDMYLAGHALITKCQIYYTLSLSLSPFWCGIWDAFHQHGCLVFIFIETSSTDDVNGWCVMSTGQTLYISWGKCRCCQWRRANTYYGRHLTGVWVLVSTLSCMLAWMSKSFIVLMLSANKSKHLYE